MNHHWVNTLRNSYEEIQRRKNEELFKIAREYRYLLRNDRDEERSCSSR
jgi:hypothetical protein